jgi:hypothetical protein
MLSAEGYALRGGWQPCAPGPDDASVVSRAGNAMYAPAPACCVGEFRLAMRAGGCGVSERTLCSAFAFRSLLGSNGHGAARAEDAKKVDPGNVAGDVPRVLFPFDSQRLLV